MFGAVSDKIAQIDILFDLGRSYDGVAKAIRIPGKRKNLPLCQDRKSCGAVADEIARIEFLFELDLGRSYDGVAKAIGIPGKG